MKPSWQDIIELTRQFRAERNEYWDNEVFLSLEWWILLIVGSVLLIAWLIMLDKRRVFEIVAYGMMVAIIANFGDTIGLSFSLWGYQYSLLHTPEIVEIHNIMMPILYMIVYQYFHTWKSFSIAAAINALIFTFILEPILIWLQIYELYHWKITYSLVPYFIIAIGLKWVIHKLKQMDHHYKKT